MKTWRAWAACLATAFLAAACGGGGSGTGSPILGGGDNGGPVVVGPTASDLAVTVSAATMPNVVTSSVVVTVTAVDANRATMADIGVTLSVDSGAVIQASAAKTNATGQVTGTVTMGSDTTPRRITVTAVSGSVTRTATIDVVSTAISASDLTLTIGPVAELKNSGSETVTATVTAVDANRATVAGIPVRLSVDAGATIQTSSAVTNAAGQVTGTIRIGENKSIRTIIVTAVSGSITRTAQVQVVGTAITATVLGAVLQPNQPGEIQYLVKDSAGAPIGGQQIVITGPGGVQTSAVTTAAGTYDYKFLAPTITGTVTIRASSAGKESESSIIVASTNSGSIPVVTTPVRSSSLSANPSVVPINATGNTNRSEVRALFLSDTNAPVKNIRVRFDLDGDRNSIGGSFSSGSTLVYSDANGVATSSYIPGSRFSPTDGVTVRACWSTSDFEFPACPNEAKTTLTVISDALSVTIGTNNLISEGDSKLTYVTRYIVQVVDSSGLAAAGVQVSASVDLLNYRKGFWVKGAESWVQQTTALCDNEDLNRNGVAETFSNGVVEDANGSFNLRPGRPALEPRRADVAVSFEGSSRTNAIGQVVIRIEYPQDIGSWVFFNIVVAASGVAGTEGRANFDDVLQVPAAVVNNLDANPPFVESPYGTASSATVAASIPGSSRPPVLLCTEPR